MAAQQQQAKKILTRIKGLAGHLEEGETPLQNLPAIWDGAQKAHSETCEVIITNKRIIGYYYRSFPREKLFLDALNLEDITQIARQPRSYSPIFQQLEISTSQRKIYIRAPHQQIALLCQALEEATNLPLQELKATEKAKVAKTSLKPASSETKTTEPKRISFEESPLGITLLFAGGIILEFLGLWAWTSTNSSAVGMPICIAGFVAVAAAIFIRRQQRQSQSKRSTKP